jgi:DNA-3-methyladenine glycosylase II
MKQRKDADHRAGILISTVQPYDFALSVRAIRSFSPDPAATETSLRLAAIIDGKPVLIEVREDTDRAGQLRATSSPQIETVRLRSVVAWGLFAGLDLAPFYRLIGTDPRLAPLAQRLFGLKPMRPLSLFEMFVTAITEQQISLTAAHAIRSRLVERFGNQIDGEWAFPEAATLAAATVSDLRACGLSRQKAAYILNVASQIAEGAFDPDSLRAMSDDVARETIMGMKGFGAWSADYILVRGLARTDSVPVADIGIQRVVGEYLGEGARLDPAGVERALSPFRPFRGLLAFYLLVGHRLIS